MQFCCHFRNSLERAQVRQTAPPCSGAWQESRSSWVCSLPCIVLAECVCIYSLLASFLGGYHPANSMWPPFFPAACNHTVIILLSSLVCHFRARSHCRPEPVPSSLLNVVQLTLLQQPPLCSYYCWHCRFLLYLSLFFLSSVPQFQTIHLKVLKPTALHAITNAEVKNQRGKSIKTLELFCIGLLWVFLKRWPYDYVQQFWYHWNSCRGFVLVLVIAKNPCASPSHSQWYQVIHSHSCKFSR